MKYTVVLTYVDEHLNPFIQPTRLSASSALHTVTELYVKQCSTIFF